jgi:hypothetical protein
MPAWLTFDGVANVCSVLSLVFAFLAALQTFILSRGFKREKQRLAKTVKVVLNYGARKIELPVVLRRGELTRAEVQGLLGVLPMKKKQERYSIAYLNKAEFFHQLRQISDAWDDAILTIPIDDAEFNQFDLP